MPFGSAALEAWLSGTPVISLKIDPNRIIERQELGTVPGNRELKPNGLLAPPPGRTPRWQPRLAHGACGAPRGCPSGPQQGVARRRATLAGAGHASQDGLG
jgi:hypothetical protein